MTTMYVIGHDLVDSCLYSLADARVLLSAGDSETDKVLREATDAEISGGIVVRRERRETTYNGPGRNDVSPLVYMAWVDGDGNEVKDIMRGRTRLAADPSLSGAAKVSA